MKASYIKRLLRLTLVIAAMVAAGGVGAQAQISGSRSSSFTYLANGLLNSETIEPGNAQLCMTTSYTYDAYGNKSSARTANCSGATGLARFEDRNSSTVFEAQNVSVAGVSNVAVPAGTFATGSRVAITANIADADSHTETRIYDPRFGIVTSLTGPNGAGLSTKWTVDAFGRKTEELRADLTKTVTFYCYLAGSFNGVPRDTSSNTPNCPIPGAGEVPADAAMYQHTEPRNANGNKMGVFSRVYMDRAGRKLRTVTEAFNGLTQPGGAARLIVQDTDYNAYGAQVLQTQPYFLDTGSSLATGTAGYGMTYTELDTLGRPTAVYTTDATTATANSPFGQAGGYAGNIAFGARGSRQAAKTTIAYSGLTTTVTDDKNRTRREEKNPDGKVVRVTDSQGISPGSADGAQVVHQHDAFGNLIQTKDALGNLVTISYDVRGRKVQLNDPDAGVITYCYDALGQLKAQQTSAMRGSHATTVACPSNDGSGTTAPTVSGWATLAYDRVGRLVHRVEPEYATNWYFDKYFGGVPCNKGIGKLCESRTSHGVNRKTGYDDLGRPDKSRTDVSSGPSMGTAVSYNVDDGRVASQTYPSGVQIGYAYTTKGYLSQVKLLTTVTVNPLPASAGGSPAAARTLATGAVLWQMQAANAWGKAELTTLGVGSSDMNSRAMFDAQTGRLLNLTAGKGSASDVVNQGYTWDNGNLLIKRIDALGDGASPIQVMDKFDYDSVGQLAQYAVSGGSASSPSSRTVALQYNAAGLLLYKSDVGVYSYPAQGTVNGRPHALQGVSGTVNASFSYDLNGNLLTSTGGKYRTVEYTSFNLPTGNTSSGGIGGPGGTPRYAWMYDEGHARIKETRISAAGTRVTWNLHPDNQGGLGFEREEAANGMASNRHYISAGGSAVAVLVTVGALPTLQASDMAPSALTTIVARKLEYWHKDHLGSLIATTDHLGTVTARYAYDPFGKRRFTNSSYDAFGTLVVDWSTEVSAGTDRGYTGHEHLDDVGLIHMNGRIFDPTLARFMQADPFIQAPENLQSFDRYQYCLNNPLTCTDPSGFSWLSDRWHAIWRNPIARAVIAIVVTYVTYGAASEYLAFTAQVGATGTAYGAAAISGFAGGSISGGSLKSGLQGAFSAMIFAGVGDLIQGDVAFKGGSLGVESRLAQVALHGVAGCISSASGGGKCSAGALSAAFSKTLAVNGLTEATSPVEGAIKSSIAGGFGSTLGGGKFENGAMTGAFSYLFNCLAHECLQHYTEGSGKPMQASFSELGADGVGPERFPQFRSLVSNEDLPDGTYKVDDKIGWQTQSLNARAAYGRVILQLSGDLTVSQGQYTFAGTISAPPDPYDFDKRPWGERTYAGEASTRGGAMLPGKPFNNVFNGNNPINTGGMLSPFCCGR